MIFLKNKPNLRVSVPVPSSAGDLAFLITNFRVNTSLSSSPFFTRIAGVIISFDLTITSFVFGLTTSSTANIAATPGFTRRLSVEQNISKTDISHRQESILCLELLWRFDLTIHVSQVFTHI